MSKSTEKGAPRSAKDGVSVPLSDASLVSCPSCSCFHPFHNVPQIIEGSWLALLFIYFKILSIFGHTTRHEELLPDQGSNLCPLQWKRGVLTTGPPGKSWLVLLKGSTGNLTRYALWAFV